MSLSGVLKASLPNAHKPTEAYEVEAMVLLVRQEQDENFQTGCFKPYTRVCFI